LAHRVPINIRVDRFEGPLDLLLYLIQSHELDVSKIAISKITDQYLAYVRLMQELDFDIASDFLLMAATLIQWKSKSLLPLDVDPNALALGDGDDALSPEDLLRQLLEHQRFLDAGAELARLPLLGDDVYQRPNTRKPTEKVWKAMDVTSLAVTFQDLLVKERKRTTILKKETVSLAEKILDFGDRMEVGKLTGLRALLRDPNSRPETVVSFLATLELGRLKKMRLHQEKAYEEIYVELLESIKGFNTDLARGFDSVEDAIDQGIAERAAEGKGHAVGTAAAAAAGIYPKDAAPAVRGTEIQLADELGTSPSDADLGGAEASDADQLGTPPSDADFGGAETSDADQLGTPASGPDLSGTSPSDADLGGVDLAAFGESSEPDLKSVLSGHSGSKSGSDDGDHGRRGENGVESPVHQSEADAFREQRSTPDGHRDAGQ
jgi:segregation and condensation protein A